MLNSKDKFLNNYYRHKSKMKIGRNDPCPCGSGKKHKKCCMDMQVKTILVKQPAMVIEEPVDQLSNRTMDLIHEGKYEQAKKGCERLLKEFPELIDGYDRFAALYEKKGDIHKALEYYQKCFELIKNEQQIFYSPETAEFYKSQIKRLKEKKG